MPRFQCVKISAASAAIVLVGLFLAGCKTSTAATASGRATATSQTATPAASPTQPSSTATVPPSTGRALTGLPAACPTAAQVSSILAISAPQPVQSKTATTLDCIYIASGSAANSLSINCSTAKKLTPASAEAALKAQGTSANFQAVPGVGDAAFYDTAPTGGAYIVVISGPLTFHIVVTGDETLPELTAMAQAILGS